jgi:hypothetical protein
MPGLSGKCLCGRVHYADEAEPVLMRTCHCKDCQRFAASAFLTAVAVPAGSVVVTGDPKVYMQPGGISGLPLHRTFCPDCGSSLMIRRNDMQRIILLAGSLDDTSFVQPNADIFCIFCESKQAWLTLPPHIPAYPRYET